MQWRKVRPMRTNEFNHVQRLFSNSIPSTFISICTLLREQGIGMLIVEIMCQFVWSVYMRKFVRFIIVFIALLLRAAARTGKSADLDRSVLAADERRSLQWRFLFLADFLRARSGYVTPRGTYSPTSLQTMHHSKKYHNSPMPHSIFFPAATPFTAPTQSAHSAAPLRTAASAFHRPTRQHCFPWCAPRARAFQSPVRRRRAGPSPVSATIAAIPPTIMLHFTTITTEFRYLSYAPSHHHGLTVDRIFGEVFER